MGVLCCFASVLYSIKTGARDDGTLSEKFIIFLPLN